MLPVEAQTMAVAPSSTAFATAMTMPRSLNEPVGLAPSSFRYRFGSPHDAPRRSAWTSGVAPSPEGEARRGVGHRQEGAVPLQEARTRPAPRVDGGRVDRGPVSSFRGRVGHQSVTG